MAVLGGFAVLAIVGLAAWPGGEPTVARPGSSVVSGCLEGLKDPTTNAVGQTTDSASEATDSLQDAAGKETDQTTEATDSLQDAAGKVTDQTTDAAGAGGPPGQVRAGADPVQQPWVCRELSRGWRFKEAQPDSVHAVISESPPEEDTSKKPHLTALMS